MPKEVTAPNTPAEKEAPRLRRVLGRWDLVLLFVVAVFNLNVAPSIAANGGVTVWLWIAQHERGAAAVSSAGH